MIGRITGVLEKIDELTATLVEPGGVIAYELQLPAFLVERLGNSIGTSVTFTTFHYLEGQGQGAWFIPRLIGFSSTRERDFFELFTTVKGIGNRKALRAMAVEPKVIAAAIIEKDSRALTKLPEIGKRLAETIIAELTGKVESFLGAVDLAPLDINARGAAGRATPNPNVDEAIMALVALGETRADAERFVARAMERARREGTDVGTAESLLQAVFALRAG